MKNIIAIIAALILLSSCTEITIDVEPEGVVSIDQVDEIPYWRGYHYNMEIAADGTIWFYSEVYDQEGFYTITDDKINKHAINGYSISEYVAIDDGIAFMQSDLKNVITFFQNNEFVSYLNEDLNMDNYSYELHKTNDHVVISAWESNFLLTFDQFRWGNYILEGQDVGWFPIGNTNNIIAFNSGHSGWYDGKVTIMNVESSVSKTFDNKFSDEDNDEFEVFFSSQAMDNSGVVYGYASNTSYGTAAVGIFDMNADNTFVTQAYATIDTNNVSGKIDRLYSFNINKNNNKYSLFRFYSGGPKYVANYQNQRAWKIPNHIDATNLFVDAQERSWITSNEESYENYSLAVFSNTGLLIDSLNFTGQLDTFFEDDAGTIWIKTSNYYDESFTLTAYKNSEFVDYTQYFNEVPY